MDETKLAKVAVIRALKQAGHTTSSPSVSEEEYFKKRDERLKEKLKKKQKKT